jgi:hypothetical protein
MKQFVLLALFLGCYMTASAQQPSNNFSFDRNNFSVNTTESTLLTTMTQSVSTQILQIGNNNNIEIEAKQMQVTQLGDNHSLYYTETSKLQDSNMNIQMDGVNNYIEIYGNNSIIENMQINVSGSDKSIIIRNY